MITEAHYICTQMNTYCTQGCSAMLSSTGTSQLRFLNYMFLVPRPSQTILHCVWMQWKADIPHNINVSEFMTGLLKTLALREAIPQKTFIGTLSQPVNLVPA